MADTKYVNLFLCFPRLCGAAAELELGLKDLEPLDQWDLAVRIIMPPVLCCFISR